MDQEQIVSDVPYMDLEAAIEATLKIVRAGQEVSMESFEILAEKGGPDFVQELNKALLSSGLVKKSETIEREDIIKSASMADMEEEED